MSAFFDDDELLKSVSPSEEHANKLIEQSLIKKHFTNDSIYRGNSDININRILAVLKKISSLFNCSYIHPDKIRKYAQRYNFFWGYASKWNIFSKYKSKNTYFYSKKTNMFGSTKKKLYLCTIICISRQFCVGIARNIERT